MIKWIMPVILLFLFLTGCVRNPEACIYADRGSWVLCDSEKTDSDYDVFYVYPTLEGKSAAPEMEWLGNPKLQKKISSFALAQTYGIFGRNIRAFSPYVHQLTYQSVLQVMNVHPLPKAGWKYFERGMKETLAAFRHYLRHYNHGRPYILLGHSQGSMDLYYLIEHCPEIRKENGFVAAYLAGLPYRTEKQIAEDSGNRVKAARNADDLGVTAVWNTQNAEANPSFPGGKGSYCINPLNWRTDAAPAGRDKHILAYFYDYRNGSVKTQKGMFGAQVDPVRGVLIVDLPSDSVWDAKGFMGKGIFHMNDIWFFAGNLRANAEHRVRNWKKEFKK